MPQSPARTSGLLDASARPIPSAMIDRVRGSAGGGFRGSYLGGSFSQGGAFPYDAAAWDGPEFANWNPWLRSPDGEINQHRDRMVARQRDLYRNDGFAHGLIGRILDSTIGGYYRLAAKPDYQALTARFGKGFDKKWASEFRQRAEAGWRSYVNDPRRFNDVSRALTGTQQFRLLLGHKLVDGEATGVRYWLPERVGYGAARYASALLVVDPDRLSNPFQQPDDKNLRGGVEIDDHGVSLAYHFRKAHQNDYYNAVDSMTWERVAREDDDGFLRVIHDFDPERAGQHRGLSLFAPVLSRMKMLAKYYGLKLQVEAVAAAFGVGIRSPMDRDLIQQMLEDGESEDRDYLGGYAAMRQGWHERSPIKLDNVRIAELAPGEEFTSFASGRPPGEMTPFAHEMLRSVGMAAGVSGEQITNDYSEVNFSSMRVGIVNSEKTYKRRLDDFNANSATPIYAGWLSEAMDLGEFDDVMPRNAPAFEEARAEYSRCGWLGAARGWYDPVAERQGKILGLEAGLDTLEDAAAEQGADWEEQLDQRAIELERCRELGIPPPTWLMAQAASPSQKPMPPEAE